MKEKIKTCKYCGKGFRTTRRQETCSKECRSKKIVAYVKEWNKRNPEKRKASTKRYLEKHREEINKRQKLWFQKIKEDNPEYYKRRIEYTRTHWKEYIERLKENPEKYKEYKKQRIEQVKKWRQRIKEDPKKYKEYREKKKEQVKKYYEQLKEEDPERYRKYIGALGKRKLKLRFEIFARDNFTCQYCGKKSPEVMLEVDHIYPKSKGGKSSPDNYITACKECNLGKSDSILSEFK